MTRQLHAGTWLIWTLATAACVILAPNPLYESLILGIVLLTVRRCRLPETPHTLSIMLRVGVVFLFIRVGLTVLTTHAGNSFLLRTPAFTLPRFFGGFTIGGPIETQVLMSAINQALLLLVILAIFGAFNEVAPVSQLVRALPRALFHFGLVLSIALATLPNTFKMAQQVREADQARTGGRRVRHRRWSRWVRVIIEQSTEQAITLGESLDTRGFALKNKRTRFQPERMYVADSVVMGASLFAPCALFVMQRMSSLDLGWSWPDWPAFDAPVVFALLFLLAPVAYSLVTENEVVPA